jgi:hypothetical protein
LQQHVRCQEHNQIIVWSIERSGSVAYGTFDEKCQIRRIRLLASTRIAIRHSRPNLGGFRAIAIRTMRQKDCNRFRTDRLEGASRGIDFLNGQSISWCFEFVNIERRPCRLGSPVFPGGMAVSDPVGDEIPPTVQRSIPLNTEGDPWNYAVTLTCIRNTC